MKRIIGLQILRGVAAWMVVFHHFMQSFYAFKTDNFLGRFFSDHGHFGVDIFFVLSGCVMYLATRNKPMPVPFLLGRMFRIVPVYWFYTWAIILAIWFIPQSFAYTKATPSSILCSLIFLPCANPSGLGYFPTLTVGWTLNYEIFFYLLLGLCIAISRRSAVILCVITLLVIPVVYPMDWFYTQVAGSKLLYEFVAGLVLAAVYGRIVAIPQFLQVHRRNTILLIFIVTLAFGCWLYVQHREFASLAIASSLVWGALAVQPGKFLSDSWLGAKLVKLGDISYSTYLSHAIVIGIFLHFFDANPSGLALAWAVSGVALITYFTSVLSHRMIETHPVLNGWKLQIQETLTSKEVSVG